MIAAKLTCCGIGKKTAEKLLKEFGSVEKVKQAETSLLEQHVGKAATKKILDYFNDKNEKE